MGLKQTTALPLSLTHPRLGHVNFQRDTQTMIDKLYNAIRQNIQGSVLVGLLADMPIAGNPGRTFYAYDKGAYYVDDGTQWTQIAGGAMRAITVPFSASPYSAMLSEQLTFYAVSASASADFVFNLPVATGSGLSAIIKKVDANPHNIVVNAASIDGAGSQTIALQYDSIRVNDFAVGAYYLW